MNSWNSWFSHFIKDVDTSLQRSANGRWRPPVHHLHSRGDGDGGVAISTFHNISYVLEQFGTGKPCVICQDKTRLVEFPLRVGTGARCVRAEGSRSLARPQGQRRTHPVEGTVFLFLCHPPITRRAACGRSRRTSSSSGSSARRAGLEEARLVNLSRQSSVFPVLWQAIPVMMSLQRGCWATSRRRSSRRALQVCLS